jgi:hypothetical protein
VTVPAGAPPPLGCGPQAGPQSPIFHVEVIAVADHCPPSDASSAASATLVETKNSPSTTAPIDARRTSDAKATRPSICRRNTTEKSGTTYIFTR